MCEIINYAPSGASKTGWDMERTSARENIGSNVAKMLGLLVKVLGCVELHQEVIIVRQAFDVNHKITEYEPSTSTRPKGLQVLQLTLPHQSGWAAAPPHLRGTDMRVQLDVKQLFYKLDEDYTCDHAT
ncbi:uncharacterized protein HD556DRAFT_1304454 [Suillus plorans]|uniref:Uncharacterized protein n=1 Tax=Suillus plorans TaxID=116603 RepID=A0A9P7J3R9_9AGAM|nr:uncharacterized protein HD556DRAFT_1304454 [Suillus plorans]KAG1801322.1 hypothetical protein HD556DRAFT_1304454 [Suillus plorans]